tara:strand:+ start:301 stop:483 length:183 start_codon:yes stop_codon:yes gene_type:complete
MKILGYILIAVAVVDFVGSWLGFDFWLEVLGINLTGYAYQFSAFVVGGIGYMLVQAGSEE